MVDQTDKQTEYAEPVKELLQKKYSDHPEGTVPVDLDPEELKAAVGGSELPTDPRPRDLDAPVHELPDDTTMSDEDRGRAMRAAVLQRQAEEFEKNITELQKRSFLKAAMSDDDLEWDMELMGGQVRVAVRSLGNHDYDVMNTALKIKQTEKLEGDHGTISNETDVVTYTQDFSIIMQARTVNGEELETFWRADPKATTRTNAEALLAHRESRMKIGSGRRSLLLAAVSEFTGRYKVCTEAWLNRNFWSPAD
jgi:hypothetical protein